MENEKSSSSTGVLILAAGSSSRLGEPKQLLPFKNENLIRHAVNIALGIKPIATVVVLGSDAEKVSAEIKDFPVDLVLNTGYTEGIASSIRCGVQHFMDHYPMAKGLIIMLCDQPYVESWLLEALIQTKKEQRGSAIVASFYDEDCGVPALFDVSLFPALLQLEGDKGAKSLMKQYPDLISMVQFPLGNVDIDTWEAYERWI